METEKLPPIILRSNACKSLSYIYCEKNPPLT